MILSENRPPASRHALVGAFAAAVLALAGCAVTGADGDPGIATDYAGMTHTHEDVDARFATMVDLGQASHPGVAATQLVLGPSLVALASKYEPTFTEEEARRAAVIWMAENRLHQSEPTAEMMTVVRESRALFVLTHSAPGATELLTLVLDVQDNAVVSPRYGTFKLAAFDQSLQFAFSTYDLLESQFDGVPFRAFSEMRGFYDVADADWISRD